MQEATIAIANQPNDRGIVYSEQALRKLADNKQFFYDEKNKRLIFKFDAKISELRDGTVIYKGKK